MATNDLFDESWNESLQWLVKWVVQMQTMTCITKSKVKHSTTEKSIGKTRYITVKKVIANMSFWKKSRKSVKIVTVTT